MRLENRVGATSCEHDYTDVIDKDFGKDSWKYIVRCRKCDDINRYQGSMESSAPVPGTVFRGAKPIKRRIELVRPTGTTSGKQLGGKTGVFR